MSADHHLSPARRRGARGRVLALLAGAVVLGGCASSSFVDDTNATASESPEQAVVSRIMTSLGAIDPRAEPIDYRPRSPLVVPPDRNLRTPVETAPGDTAANWPRDPEAMERARRQAALNQPTLDPSRNWTPEQLRQQNAAQGIQPRESAEMAELRRRSLMDPDGRESSRPLKPDELQGRNRVELVTVDSQGKPRRRGLTEPPITYLEPSPNAPIGEPPKPKDGGWSWWPF
jgi:hypothetical protein